MVRKRNDALFRKKKLKTGYKKKWGTKKGGKLEGGQEDILPKEKGNGTPLSGGKC